MVPFSKSSVCVCHILPPLSWSTHSSLLCLLLPARTCTSCVVVFSLCFFFCLRSMCPVIVFMSEQGGRDLSVISVVFFFTYTSSDLWFNATAPHNPISFFPSEFTKWQIPENFLKHPHTVGLTIAKFDAANLNEITKLSFCVWPFLMSVCFYLLFSSQKCIHTYTKCFAAICTFHVGGNMNVSTASQSNNWLLAILEKKILEKLPQHFYTLDENGFSSQMCHHFNHLRMYNPTSKCLGYIPQQFLVEKIEFCSHCVDFSDVLCCSSCVQCRVLQTVTWTPCSLIMSVCGCLSSCGFVYRLCSSCICLSFLPPPQTDRDKKKNAAKASALQAGASRLDYTSSECLNCSTTKC